MPGFAERPHRLRAAASAARRDAARGEAGAALRGPRRAGPCVVGFDLAGAERGHPCAEHADALALVRRAGLPMTLHAGEDDAAERVLEAARHGARRIGHGVRLADALADPKRAHLVDEARAFGLHLEICPSSNVQTGAAVSIAAHPITALWRAGISVSVHTDNPLFSRTSMSGEAAALLRETPLTTADLLAMTRGAAAASFLGIAAREAALKRIEAAARGEPARGRIERTRDGNEPRADRVERSAPGGAARRGRSGRRGDHGRLRAPRRQRCRGR
ncbi:MAG: amidohydrolase family protein [Rubrivivax sp.]